MFTAYHLFWEDIKIAADIWILEEILSAFKLKYKCLLRPVFASPVNKDPILKSAKVFGV